MIKDGHSRCPVPPPRTVPADAIPATASVVALAAVDAKYRTHWVRRLVSVQKESDSHNSSTHNFNNKIFLFCLFLFARPIACGRRASLLIGWCLLDSG